MKVLWLVNIILPDFAKAIGHNARNVGGWLQGQLKALQNEDLEICVCTVSEAVKELTKANAHGVEYIAFPINTKLEKAFKELIDNENPQVVHIFGTERQHSLAMAKACDYKRCLVTIQGLTSECLPHYFDGLPEKYKYKNPIKAIGKKLLNTVGLYPNIILSGYKEMMRVASAEQELLQNARFFTGRTHWDKAAIKKINPSAEYFHLNENLREPFYGDEKWRYSACVPQSVFVSQANFPIKGFHMLLKAAYAVKKQYPNLQIYVGGEKPVSSEKFIIKQCVGYFFEYQGYLKSLIKQYNLEQNVVFLGSLNAEQMKEQYLKANVFVSPSAIENSPNSVCEAMILGTPVIASNVGGVSSLLTNEAEGLLYNFHNTKKLADSIIRIFEDAELANSLSENAMARAVKTHNKQSNSDFLIEIYNLVATR